MGIVKDISKLSQDELIEALVYTRSVQNAGITNDIRAYYKLLSIDELKSKAAESILYYEEKGEHVSVIEMKRRDAHDSKPIVRTPLKVIPDIPLIRGPGPMENVIHDLAIRSWIKDVTEICNGVIGLRFKSDVVSRKGKKYSREMLIKKVQKIAAHYLYEGEFVYG